MGEPVSVDSPSRLADSSVAPSTDGHRSREISDPKSPMPAGRSGLEGRARFDRIAPIAEAAVIGTSKKGRICDGGSHAAGEGKGERSCRESRGRWPKASGSKKGKAKGTAKAVKGKAQQAAGKARSAAKKKTR
jgi:hypothetical protein